MTPRLLNPTNDYDYLMKAFIHGFIDLSKSEKSCGNICLNTKEKEGFANIKNLEHPLFLIEFLFMKDPKKLTPKQHLDILKGIL